TRWLAASIFQRSPERTWSWKTRTQTHARAPATARNRTRSLCRKPTAPPRDVVERTRAVEEPHQRPREDGGPQRTGQGVDELGERGRMPLDLERQAAEEVEGPCQQHGPRDGERARHARRRVERRTPPRE